MGFTPGRNTSPKSIGLQDARVRRHFPQFRYKRIGNCLVWKGVLKPSPTSPEYEIEIEYPHGGVPSVYVVSPAIAENAPHRFREDKSLCLYYPKDRSWTSSEFVATTIIPWTAEWLRFYEIWLITEEWFGPEAPHTPDK